MSGFDIKVDGLDRLLRQMIAGGKEAAPKVAQAMNEEAQLIFKQSQDEVPVLLGHLQGSGVLELARVAGSSVEVEITYGGPAAPYAAVVHEMPESTNWTKTGAKPRYLSDPVEQHVPALVDKISDRLERLLRGAK